MQLAEDDAVYVYTVTTVHFQIVSKDDQCR